MKPVDLSYPLETGMPVWPGDPAVSLETVCTAETDGCRITRLTLGSHTGTHLDAPCHVLPGGSSLDELPPQPVFQKPEQEALYQTVMTLPENYRIVLVLFYYEELSVREIGTLLGLETSAVTTRLSRARAKLKEQLGEVWQDE